MTKLQIETEEFNNTKEIIKQLVNEGLDYDAIIDTIVNNGNEHWYPIDIFENKYSFSNLGRVKNNKTGRILGGSYMWEKYKYYCLSNNYSKSYYYVEDTYFCALDDLITYPDPDNEEVERWFPEPKPKPTPRNSNNPFI